ncbi:MAG: S1 RNA-binding domain-containing protein [Mucispirillum sp.]|nr:S1 RNA-binding domain-containing protein [Mucispirillum sp.]
MSNENKKNEERMEDFEAYFEESLQQPRTGSIVKGTIAQIKGDEVLINFGYKTEGVAQKSEFDDIKIGDEVELAVVKFAKDGSVVLSKKIINAKGDWNTIKNSETNGIPVEVKITSRVEKGYEGKVGEIDAFIPENHIDVNLKDADPAKFIGKVLTAKILKTTSGKRPSVLLSPRHFIQEETKRLKTEFFQKFKVGDTVKGVVKTMKDYGAFISLGGIDGFLHRNEMSWGRVKNPAKFLSENDEVEVVIIDINKEENKVAVGMKQLQEDPWDRAAQDYPEGSSVKGTVVARKRAGYIVEIAPGIDGFVPNEEIGWLKNTKSTLNMKDIIEGRVTGYDNERKRVIMSVKDLKENPWKTLKAQNPEGSIVKGTVKNITDFGLFVDFGSFIDGLIRKGDISWRDEPQDLNEIYKAGDTVEAKVLTIDEERERVSLGIKQLEANPWKEIGKLMPSGKAIDAKITAVTKQGLEVELPLNMKGIIAVSDLDQSKPAVDDYNVGDTVTAAVIKTDAKEKQITLSIKKYMQDSERRETKEYMKKMEEKDDSGFGNIFKDKLGK